MLLACRELAETLPSRQQPTRVFLQPLLQALEQGKPISCAASKAAQGGGSQSPQFAGVAFHHLGACCYLAVRHQDNLQQQAMCTPLYALTNALLMVESQLQAQAARRVCDGLLSACWLGQALPVL